VAKEGDAAKWHIGITAQEVLSVFADEGLDGTQYGMISCEEDRYGLRYDELNLFMMAAMGGLLGV
jgi:hypothetical protein